MKKIYVLVIGFCWLLVLPGCGGEEICRGGECYTHLYGALGEDNPCSGVDCSGHGTCFFQEDDAPFCLCEAGYASYRTECTLIPEGARDFVRDDCVDGQLMVDLAMVELGRDDTEVGVEVDVYPYAFDNYVGGEAWCSEFVSWIYVYAGDPFTGGSYGGWMLTDSYAIRTWFRNAPVDEWVDSDDPDYLEFEPQAGDYIRWDTSGGGHSNIVRYVDGTTLYTVDGNWGDRVVAREIPNYQSNSGLDGFGHRVCPNLPPTVNAGDDQSLIYGEVVHLLGTAEDDGEPNGFLTVSWSKFDGPGDVGFGDVSSAQTTATFSESGVYTLRLVADDGLAQTSDDVQIELLPNQVPLVDAGADQVVVLPRQADLPGSASDDGVPPGGLLVIAWSVVDGPDQVVFDDSSAPQTSVSFNVPGVYTLRLSADDGLLLGSDDVIIEVLENQAPLVEAGPPRTVLLPGQAALAGQVADDGLPDNALAIAWSKVSGPGAVTFEDGSSPATDAAFSDTGSYQLRLTASDGLAEVSDEVTVVVIRNYPPSVNAGPDQLVEFPQTVTLSGVVSDDGWPDGTLEIEWSASGSPLGQVTIDDAGSAVTTATFSEPGSYTLLLTAGDGELFNSDEVLVVLQADQPPEENLPPTVEAGANQIIKIDQAAELSGTAGDDGLPDGILNTTWSLVKGPGQVSFADANALQTTATFSITGFYTLRLTADDGVLQTFDQLIVTVETYHTGAEPPAKTGCNCQSGPGGATLPGFFIALLLCGIVRSRARKN